MHSRGRKWWWCHLLCNRCHQMSSTSSSTACTHPSTNCSLFTTCLKVTPTFLRVNGKKKHTSVIWSQRGVSVESSSWLHCGRYLTSVIYFLPLVIHEWVRDPQFLPHWKLRNWGRGLGAHKVDLSPPHTTHTHIQSNLLLTVPRRYF